MDTFDVILIIIKFGTMMSRVALCQTCTLIHSAYLTHLKISLLKDFQKFLNHVSLKISKPLMKKFEFFWISSSLNQKMNFWNFWQKNKQYHGNCFAKIDLLMNVLQFIDKNYDNLSKLKNEDEYLECCRILENFFKRLHQIGRSGVKHFIHEYTHMKKIIIFLTPNELKMRCDSIVKIFPEISSRERLKLSTELHQITPVLCHLLCGRSDQIENSVFGSIFWYSVFPPRVSYCIDTVAPFLLLGSRDGILKRLSLHLDTLETLSQLRNEAFDQIITSKIILCQTIDAFYFYLDKSQPDDITLIQKDNIHDIIAQFIMMYHQQSLKQLSQVLK